MGSLESGIKIFDSAGRLGLEKRSSHRIPLRANYAGWLTRLKQRIQGARQRALLAANNEQIRFDHDIGREILDCQNRQGAGTRSESMTLRVSSSAASPGTLV